jgi:hypothetical protein
MWKNLSQIVYKNSQLKRALLNDQHFLNKFETKSQQNVFYSKFNLNNSNTNRRSILFESNKTQNLTCKQIVRKESKIPDMKTEFKSESNAPKQQAPKSGSSPSSLKKLLMIFLSGGVTYFALSYYIENRMSKSAGATDEINYESQNLPGKIKPNISINREKNPGNIRLTLYQYVTCPFCCKVRAYLDYYGYSYDIVEVNSITKKQIDWSSYKKVPILAVQFPSNSDSNAYDQKIIVRNLFLVYSVYNLIFLRKSFYFFILKAIE